ncbi:MAG TPA: phenylalanine--tRNA ligase subunit beta [Moorella mulderi]|nr:phenylalanine--tRNA ligase subunit beta [Moorella mulderi]
MRIPYNWLKKYVKVDLPSQELAHLLTMAGLEVEGIEDLSLKCKGVVVGEIRSLEPHPYADRLWVCQVDVGERVIQLVTGAPNVRAGQKVAVALEGARLPDGQEIKRASFRGVVSQGMLCSPQELGLDPGLFSAEEREGIISLPPDSPPGEDISRALGLEDQVLVLELTPNRGDCLSIWGVAREVAALTGAPLCWPHLQLEEEGNIEEWIAVEIESPELCPRYLARVVTGVKVAPSPAWLQGFLRACGLRPINNVVDITNFVMWEMGQPLHAFDYDKLGGKRIIVRTARPGEKIVTLDGEERLLDPSMLVIADEKDPVAVAGVMGGLESEVTFSTCSVLIEAACFDNISIRRTSKRLGLRSEASLRFERGVDVEAVPKAADRAAQLMAQLAGGKVIGGRLDAYPRKFFPVTISLRPERVNELLGTSLPSREIKELLERLHLEVRGEGPFQVKVPSFRRDLKEEADLIEEVARIYGYDRITPTLPGQVTSRPKQTWRQKWEQKGREAAFLAGLSEVVTYSFISPRIWDHLLLPPEHPWRRALKIANPLKEDHSVMRPSLLPGLLQVALRNFNRKVTSLEIYEVGRVFLPREGDLPEEPLRLAGLVMGVRDRAWNRPTPPLDFYYLKGVVENILSRVRCPGVIFEATSSLPFLHPGRAALLEKGEEVLGYLGELHPQVLKNIDLPCRACVFELDWERVGRHSQDYPRHQPLPRYPSVERDLALVVKEEVPARAVEEVIKEAGGDMLWSCRLFDVYRGDPVPPGCKSLAFSLVFRVPHRTLTEEEVNRRMKRIEEELVFRIGASVRR